MSTIGNGNPISNHWYLVSSHGAVLFYIAVNPDCTIREIADEMSLTQRTVWGLIGDLRRAEMLDVRREGRRHHYTVNLNAHFKHPTVQGVTLRTIMADLVAEHARTPANRPRHSSRA
ncbi:MAG: winged helix-turn-helix domain-containing protein [Dehalococcoidia bacterium]